MLKAFSTAATGMAAQQTMVDSIANNLANINTNGFKRSQVNFQDLLYLKMREAGREVAAGITAPSGLEIGSGVRMSSTTRVFTVGELKSTGRDLDVAIQGDGFLEVTLPGGESRYTRDGSLQMNADGELVNAGGYQLASGITIPSDATSVGIEADGTVSVLAGDSNSVVGTIELVRFANPAGLTAEGGNLYRATEASGDAISGTAGENGYGALLSQHLEKSNVQTVDELVGLIAAQRAYEINSRCVRVGDDMLQKLNNIIR